MPITSPFLGMEEEEEEGSRKEGFLGKRKGEEGGLGRAGPQSWAEVATDSPLPTRFKIEHSLVSKKQFNFPSSAVLTKQMHYFHPFKGRSQRLGKRVMQRPNRTNQPLWKRQEEDVFPPAMTIMCLLVDTCLQIA